MLADWPRRSAQFTKIMPTDYQRVLQATRMAKAEGRDVDTAIMEASSWLTHRDFCEVPRSRRAKRPVDERVGDWREVYERQDPPASAPREVSPAGPPVHGLRNPVLPLAEPRAARWAT